MIMKLMELFVEIMGDKKPLDSTLDEAERHAKSSGEKMGASIRAGFGIGAGMALFHGAIEGAKGMFEWLHHAVEGAMDLNGAMFRVKLVLGDSSKQAGEFAEKMAKLGYSKVDTLNAIRGYADLSTQMGKTAAEAEKLSETLASRAADMAIGKDKTYNEVLAQQQSLLMGRTRAFLGMSEFITEADVKQYAFTHHLIQAGQAMSDSAKQAATLGLYLEKTSGYAGLAEESLGGAKGQLRLFTVHMEELQEKVGNALLPVFTALVTGMNEFIDVASTTMQEALGPAWDWLKDQVDMVIFGIKHAGSVFQIWQIEAAIAITKVEQAFMNFGSTLHVVWDLVKGEAIATFQAIVNHVKAMWEAIMDLGKLAYATMTGGDTSGMKGMKDIGKELLGKEAESGKGFADAWKKAMSSPEAEAAFGANPAVDALKKQLDDLFAELGKKWEAEHKAKPEHQGPAVGKGGPEAAAVKPKEATFTDLVEWSKKMQTGVFGQGTAEKQLATLTDIKDINRQQLEASKKPATPAPAVAGA